MAGETQNSQNWRYTNYETPEVELWLCDKIVDGQPCNDFAATKLVLRAEGNKDVTICSCLMHSKELALSMFKATIIGENM